MADLKALRSVGGFSVGELPVDIIQANGDITGTSISANGNITFTGANVSLGDIANLHISGGTPGQSLITDGTGNLSFTSFVFTQLSNGTSNVQVLNNGNVTISSGGNANIVVVSDTGMFVSGTANITGNTDIIGNISVTGNANVGNIGANNAVFTGTGSFSGNVDLNTYYINNLSDPDQPQDAATKNYVDTVAQGLHIHPSANAATTANLATITGGTVTYNNGVDGVGANLTISGGTLTVIDTIPLSANMRLLIKNEANATWNGVYVYNNNTVITRATDFDTPTEVLGGDFLFVTSGYVNADTGWVQITDAPIVFGTSPIIFTQFSGAGTYQAGTGLTLTGTVFSVNTTQTQIVEVGTLGNLSVSGNTNIGNLNVTNKSNLGSVSNITITGGSPSYFLQTDGSGNLNWAQVSIPPGTQINNGNSNVDIPVANGNVTVSVTGVSNVVVISNTGMDISGTISSSGNITGGNLITQNNVYVGNTSVTWATTTTYSVTPDQVLANINVTASGIIGIEYIIKGNFQSGARASVCTIQAITDGTNVDWSQYGGQKLGGATGTFNLGLVTTMGNTYLNLMVTPASSNPTDWITQYRII